MKPSDCKQTMKYAINNITKSLVYARKGIDLFKQRKLKEFVSVDKSKKHIGEEIFICDRTHVYGIVILNTPNSISRDIFNSHFKRHKINTEDLDNYWPYENRLNTYSFRIRKVFKKPFKYKAAWQSDFTIGDFVEDVEIVKEEQRIDLLKSRKDNLENFISKKAVDGKEELKNLFINLYKLFIKRQEEKL